MSPYDPDEFYYKIEQGDAAHDPLPPCAWFYTICKIIIYATLAVVLFIIGLGLLT